MRCSVRVHPSGNRAKPPQARKAGRPTTADHTSVLCITSAEFRPNQTGIHRKALAADQTSLNARAHNTLEHAAENAAVAEPFIAGPRKRRVIRHLVLNREPT